MILLIMAVFFATYEQNEFQLTSEWSEFQTTRERSKQVDNSEVIYLSGACGPSDLITYERAEQKSLILPLYLYLSLRLIPYLYHSSSLYTFL